MYMAYRRVDNDTQACKRYNGALLHSSPTSRYTTRRDGAIANRHDEESFQSKSAYSLLDFEPSKFTQCTSPDIDPRTARVSAKHGFMWLP